MQVDCPHCKQAVDWPQDQAVEKLACPHCGLPVPAPAGQTPEPAEPVGAGDKAPGFSLLDNIPESEPAQEDAAPVAPASGGASRLFKVIAVLLPLAALVAAGVWGGLEMRRRAYVQSIEEQFSAVEDAYRAADMERAEELAGQGVGLIEARPEAMPEERAGQLRRRSGEIKDLVVEWRQAATLMEGVDFDPAGVRAKIEKLHEEAAGRGADGQPLAKLFGEMLAVARGKELAVRRARMEAGVSGVEGLLGRGEFGEVRKKLEAAGKQPEEAPEKMAAELRDHFAARIEVADAFMQKFEAAAAIKKAADKAFSRREPAAAELGEALKAIEEKTEAEKHFAALLREWVEELGKDPRSLPAPWSLTKDDLLRTGRDFAAAWDGLKFDEKSVDVKRNAFAMSDADHQYRVVVANVDGRALFVIEIDGIRLAYPATRSRNFIRYEMIQAGVQARVLRDSGREEAYSAKPWQMDNGPGPTNVLVNGDRSLLCTAGKVWDIKITPPREPLVAAAGRFKSAAADLEADLLADRRSGKDLREILTLVVNSSYQDNESSSNFLPGPFCRQAVYRRYIERNAPDLAKRLAGRLKDYRAAYEDLVRFHPTITGTAGESELECGLSADWGLRTGLPRLWRIYDAKEDTTTFALRHKDSAHVTMLFVHNVFAGRQGKWPAAEVPKVVRMVHQSVGEVASWDPATEKMTFDAEGWKRALRLEDMGKSPAHFKTADWRLPPHVLLLDSQGNALGMVTPGGRLDMPEFGDRDGQALRDAQDAFIDQCAKVMRSPGELHLFYRYFTKYCLDSPITSYPFLIGDKSHTGDVHQDAYQTLDRKIAGRFIADCDDLAEFYQTVTRRQKRLSFVLGMPSHAVCGFVERDGEDYVLSCVDTGPPRQFRGPKLEKVIESGHATFDDEHSQIFDPNSVQFLLRFAGEQTRTPYWLGTRMFVDADYAETMIRVQRAWHFAYLISGRNTMLEIAKKDASPPNCFEIAGFYRELSDWDKAVEWAGKGVAAMPADDDMSRLTESLRLAHYYDRMKRTDDAVELLVGVGEKMDAAAKTDPAGQARFLSLRFSVAAQLAVLERPWAAWKVAEPAARALAARRKLVGDNLTRIASVLLEMREAQRGGRDLTEEEKKIADDLEKLVARHLASGHFNEQDPFGMLMGKYMALAVFYAAREGRAPALEKLLADGPYPTGKRVHHKRKGTPEELEAEDWKWIHLSVNVYLYFLHDALDQRLPVEERRLEEAVRIVDALERAVPHLRKHAALGSMEFSILRSRVERAAIAKDWEDMDRVFRIMRERNWGQLYRQIATALGGAAAYMTAEEFEAQFRKFDKYDPPLPHYLRVAYESLQADRLKSALVAARVTAERFSENEDVQREYKLLSELIAERLASQPEPDPDPPPGPAEDPEAQPEEAPTGELVPVPGG